MLVRQVAQVYIVTGGTQCGGGEGGGGGGDIRTQLRGMLNSFSALWYCFPKYRPSFAYLSVTLHLHALVFHELLFFFTLPANHFLVP